MREICFDTETTGFKPEEGHRLIEIGCVEIIDGVRTENYYHVYINPERDVPEDAVKVHGLTQEYLADKPLFKDIKDDFLKYIGDAVLVAHNAAFDMKFLNSELALIGCEAIQNKVIDSLAIAKNKFPGQKNSLDALCRRFAIDSSKRVLHGALLDAELLADVYIELNGGAQKSFAVAEDTGKKIGDNVLSFEELLADIATREPRPVRDFAVSSEELEAHNNFIATVIKDPIWLREETTNE